MLVYVVFGGCWGDEHIIAIYRNERKHRKEQIKKMQNAKDLVLMCRLGGLKNNLKVRA